MRAILCDRCAKPVNGKQPTVTFRVEGHEEGVMELCASCLRSLGRWRLRQTDDEKVPA